MHTTTKTSASQNFATLAWCRALTDAALLECIDQQQACLRDATDSEFTREDRAMLLILTQELQRRGGSSLPNAW